MLLTYPLRSWHPAIVVTALLVSACTDEPLISPAPIAPARGLAGSLAIRPAESLLHELAREIPGFGGYYLEKDGSLTGYVIDSTQDERLRGRLASMASVGLRASVSPGRPVTVRRGTFDFPSLARWRDVVSSVLLGSIPGLVSVDADEALNRVTLGIHMSQHPGARDEILRRLLQLGVPAAAAHFVEQAPAEPSSAPHPTSLATNADLDDVPSPLVAGYQISAPGGCTLGPVVEHDGFARVFTNSHCTSTMYGFDGSTMRTSFGDAIGVEFSDPSPIMCVPGFWCRLGDAALFDLNDGVSYRRGAIARTIDVSYTWGVAGSLVVDQSDNFRSVTYVYDPWQVVTGLMLFKTGQTSGTTGGTVSNTCTDELASDGYVRQCSVRAGYYAAGGDSGSPVYQPNSNQAYLVGIHWGSSPSSQSSYFSYYWYAIIEIGGWFNAMTDITVSASTISGSIASGVYPSLSWTAVTTTNTTAPTVYRLRRRTWDAATQSYSEYDADVLTTESIFTHIDYDRPVNLYYGSTPPPNGVNWVQYYVLATNHGVSSVGNSVYYRRKNVF